jgi:hypothetical protein
LTDYEKDVATELNDALNFSAYPNLKGQTVQWIGDDNEEKFNYNLNNHRSKLLATGISNTDITYSINSNGFRSPEFEPGEWIAVAGCSFTFGVGVPLEHTWSKIVANHLGLQCANLGKPGAAPDTCFRMCYHWLPKLQPKALIYFEPPLGRFEILSSTVKTTKDSGLHYANIRTVSEKKFSIYAYWSRNFLNFELNYIKNKLAIQFICENLNIPMYSYKVYKDIQFDNMSRDLQHSGILANKDFAEKICREHF